jgi:hypothetical protein
MDIAKPDEFHGNEGMTQILLISRAEVPPTCARGVQYNPLQSASLWICRVMKEVWFAPG